ncbi:MAG: orotate phosphoribosyltransferase [Pseudomonadales bacterium]|nr:orotate phosphoribosyltransferase [Pseudomonadales bacterium]
MKQTKTSLSQQFIEFAIAEGVLQFGEFTLKSGRSSPYFFNMGNICSGASLDRLGRFYADRIEQIQTPVELLFGPAYKGIPLVSAASIALSRNHQIDIPYVFNRKEAKQHGEGGSLVGAPLTGQVLIIDDVITAGTAIREVLSIIEQSDAKAMGILVALDRQEIGPNGQSAIQEIEQEYGIDVYSIANVNDLIEYLEGDSVTGDELERLTTYRNQFGASAVL